MATKIDMTGQRWGRLVVLEEVDSVNGMTRWLCQCDCGEKTIVYGGNLRRGYTQSCGCYRHECENARAEANRTHGSEPRRLYRIWGDMKNRCRNPKNSHYLNYGGRGIAVCEEWLEYPAFRDWAIANGYQENLSIDRIDVNGNYTPDNCRWISMTEQNRNKRTTNWIVHNGKRMCLDVACREAGINCGTVRSRAKYSGISCQEAFDFYIAANGGNT